MAVEIEGLEFQIEAKSENAAKGVDALINSFNKLKAATKGGAGLNNISKKLDAISNAKLSVSGIEKIEDLTKSLNSLSNVKISSTISKRITEIGASLDSLDWSGVEKVEALSTALQNMQGIQIPNMRNITGNQTATPTGTAAPLTLRVQRMQVRRLQRQPLVLLSILPRLLLPLRKPGDSWVFCKV